MVVTINVYSFRKQRIMALSVIIPPLAAFVVTLLATPVVRMASRRWGFVANPAGDRWHVAPTPLHGGIAISLGLLVAALLAGVHVYLILGIGLVFLLGLTDDLFHLSPLLRVMVEFAAALLVISSGLGGVELWSPACIVAIVWIVLVSNAINLIDGADGVAASVVAATATVGGVFLLASGSVELAVLSISLAAVSFGFLTFNWPPATIFMGDSGSLVLGYLLAIIALEAGFIASGDQFILTYAVAFAFVAVPFLDATFVALVRIVLGQNPARGGTHHIHHRLRLAGLSARQTATTLGMLAAVSVSTIVLSLSQPTLFGMMLLFGATFLLLLEALLVHQTGFLPSKSGETAERRAMSRLYGWMRRISPAPKVAADAVVIATAASVAGALTQSGPATAGGAALLLAIFVTVKVAILWGMRLYRQQWLMSAGTPDLIRVLAAIVLGSVVTALIMTLVTSLNVGARFIAADFLAATLGLLGLRIGFRMFHSLIGVQRRSGTRVLIYGAGQAGAFAARELRQNADRRLKPVGFLDDDPAKEGSKLYGLSIFGDLSNLERAAKLTLAEQVILSSSKIPYERSRQIMLACRALGLRCSRMTFEFNEDAVGNGGDGFKIQDAAITVPSL